MKIHVEQIACGEQKAPPIPVRYEKVQDIDDHDKYSERYGVEKHAYTPL